MCYTLIKPIYRAHTQTHTHKHTQKHTHTQTHKQTHTQAHTQARAHKHTHTQKKRTHKHTRTHKHRHTQVQIYIYDKSRLFSHLVSLGTKSGLKVRFRLCVDFSHGTYKYGVIFNLRLSCHLSCYNVLCCLLTETTYSKGSPLCICLSVSRNFQLPDRNLTQDIGL